MTSAPAPRAAVLTVSDGVHHGVREDRSGDILAELLAAWGSFNPMLDLDANGWVGGGDLAITLSSWGPGPG